MDTGLEQKEAVLNEFRTNGFVANPQSSIVIATVCGMGLMFLTIMVGAPIIVSMVALIGGILLVYGYRVGQITYQITTSGLHIKIRIFLPYWIRKKEEYRYVLWQDVRSFKHDFDQNRSCQQYEYIKLYLRKYPGEVWIANQRDKSGFVTFRDTFLQIVAIERHNSETNTKAISEVSHKKVVEHNEPFLVKRKGFYKTTSAKIVIVLLILAAVGLVLYNQFYGLSLRNLFRLEAIIIPGVAYMIYRVLVKVED